MNIENHSIYRRICRDMNDGVLVISSSGEILHINDMCREILELKDVPSGSSYIEIFPIDDERNEDLHELIFSAIYEKNQLHTKDLDYYLSAKDDKTPKKKHLKFVSSFLMDEAKKKKVGIVVIISDETALYTLHKQRRESSIIFSLMMLGVCINTLLWGFFAYIGKPLEPWLASKMIELFSIIMSIIIFTQTDFSFKDIGLKITNVRATFIPSILLTIVGLVLLFGGKYIIQQYAPTFFPEGAPFWDWSVANSSDIIYIFTVILQEFLSRSVMQESLLRIFVGKYSVAISIVVSSAIFGVLHIAYGFPYMIASALFLGIFGIFYYKQRNIWALCIPHYILGEAAVFLRYLV